MIPGFVQGKKKSGIDRLTSSIKKNVKKVLNLSHYRLGALWHSKILNQEWLSLSARLKVAIEILYNKRRVSKSFRYSIIANYNHPFPCQRFVVVIKKRAKLFHFEFFTPAL